MDLVDVNVLVYAHREDVPEHGPMREWLEGLLAGPRPYGMSDLVLSGFVRVATHPGVFDPPSTMDQALAFAGEVRDRTNRVRITPGPRHWSLFTELCRTAGVKGNLVPDACFAALAIESGSEWVTTDRDYARFPGLRWRHPLDDTAA